MKQQYKRVLLIDSNHDERKQIAISLKRAKYSVTDIEDGTAAINKAVLEPPDIIVTAAEMPNMDGFKLCQLLRTNPATRHIPFIFITSKETNPKRLGQFIRLDDDFILRPFKMEELLGRVQNLLYRLGKVKEVSAEVDRSVAGNLTEIALVDLLQIFKMNRKSGILTVKSEGKSGVIFIREGIVINARLGKVGGQKAIFRLITWQGGTFEFKPSSVMMEVKIHDPTENLIMEGLRQLDEINSMADRLPPKNAALKVKKVFKGPESKLKPVTREVLDLLNYFSRVDDILDNSTFPDLEVYSTIQTLLQKEVVEIRKVEEEKESGEQEPLLSLEEALKIGYYLGVGQGEPDKLWTGKVIIFPQDKELMELFIARISSFQEVRIEDHASGVENDDLGNTGVKVSITIMDKITLMLLCLPPLPGFEPLWHAFQHRAVGALMLGEGKGEKKDVFSAAAEFLDSSKIPFAAVAINGSEGPEAADDVRSPEHPRLQWKYVDRSKDDFARNVLRALFEVILA